MVREFSSSCGCTPRSRALNVNRHSKNSLMPSPRLRGGPAHLGLSQDALLWSCVPCSRPPGLDWFQSPPRMSDPPLMTILHWGPPEFSQSFLVVHVLLDLPSFPPSLLLDTGSNSWGVGTGQTPGIQDTIYAAREYPPY